MLKSSNLIGGLGIGIVHGSDPYVMQSGVVWWDGNSQQLAVMNGDSKYQISNNHSSTQIVLDPTMQAVMMWVQTKMLEEKKIKDLCEQHPGLKDCKDRYEMMLVLCQDGK